MAASFFSDIDLSLPRAISWAGWFLPLTSWHKRDVGGLGNSVYVCRLGRPQQNNSSIFGVLSLDSLSEAKHHYFVRPVPTDVGSGLIHTEPSFSRWFKVRYLSGYCLLNNIDSEQD